MHDSPIHHVPLFATLRPAELDVMATRLQQSTYNANTVLFYEGELGDRLYILLEGQIAIIKALGTAEERVLGVRGPGEFVGEMSLLNRDGRRTASARMATDARVLILTHADFDALLRRHPRLAYEMLRVLSTSLRETNDAAIHDLREKNRQLVQAYADLQAAQARLVDQETLAHELRLAREIQESVLLPTLPHLADFDLGAQMIPARMVGGDFFDVIPLDPDRLGIMVGDVSGKGVPAALFMALTCSLLRTEVDHTTSPEEALRSVNRHLVRRNTKGMFVTVLYGVLHRTTREFVYVRAGHVSPLLWSSTGAMLTAQRMPAHPLGLFPDPMLDVQSAIVPPGSTLLLYTDGVTETIDAQGTLFGPERLYATALSQPEASAQELCDYLVQAVATYRGAGPQEDDLTLLAVRVPMT